MEKTETTEQKKPTWDGYGSAAFDPNFVGKEGMLDYEKLVTGRKVYSFFRRAQDIFFALLAIVVLMPFLLLIALIIFLDDPYGSPIFVQKRVGKDGELFDFYKFRSMVVNAEARLESLMDKNEKTGPVFKIKNDPRITRVGRFIRKTSIDELPQLLNVLKGDMSIVGPRPALTREVKQYNDYQRQRLYITPGLTCYWQVLPNRDDLPFDDWLDLDLRYIKDRSFLLDWKLIFQTFRAVVRGSGS